MDAGPDRPGSVPAWLRDSTAWAWRLLVVSAAVFALGWVLLRLRLVFVPAIVALLLTAILAPAVRLLQRIRVPRLGATWIVFAMSIAAFAAMGWLFGAMLNDELGDGSQWAEILDEIRNWLQTGPLDLSESQVEDLEEFIRDAIVGGLAAVDAGRIRQVFDVVAGLLIALVLAFFFVKDGPSMWTWSVRHFHPKRREVVDTAGQAAFSSLSAYMRGVAITGVVDAVFIGVGLVIIGVPLALPLAIITFFGAFFPIIGATVAGALAAVVALVTLGTTEAILVVLLTLAVQQIESEIIMPVVMARQVKLHPAAILAALTAGGAIAGIVGAFVAVPIAAMITAASAAMREQRARSGDPPDEADGENDDAHGENDDAPDTDRETDEGRADD